MYDNLVILNLQNFKRDSYISVICQAVITQRKVAHLAVARSQNTGNGILGILLKKKGSCESDCLFLSDEEKSKEPAYEYGYIMNII